MIRIFFPTPTYAVELKDQYAFGKINTLGEGFTYLVAPGFQIAAVAVVLYFIVGAFRFITSSGNKETIASARGMMVHGIIGFALLILMFSILQFVPKYFGLAGFVLIGPASP